MADVRSFSLKPRSFETVCGGLFLFIPELVRLHAERLVEAARLPGTHMTAAKAKAQSAGPPGREVTG